MSYAAPSAERGQPRDAPDDVATPRACHPIEAHRSALQNYLRRRLRAHEDPEDYVQEVYLRVLAADPGQNKVQNLRGFLFRAASNLMIDKHRRRGTSSAAAVPTDRFNTLRRLSLLASLMSRTPYLRRLLGKVTVTWAN